jgi:hypothetical protein
LIGLSPPSTTHPNLFQQIPVRASSRLYPAFTLVMDRSPGFGSAPSDWTPCSDSLSLRLPYTVKLATGCKSLTHYTKGTQSPHERGSHCLYAHGFRFYFTPLSGVLFAFPSRYWFTIGRQGVFSLGGWSPRVRTGFLVPRPTRLRAAPGFVYGAVTLCGRTFQAVPLPEAELKGCSRFARRYSGNLG